MELPTSMPADAPYTPSFIQDPWSVEEGIIDFRPYLGHIRTSKAARESIAKRSSTPPCPIAINIIPADSDLEPARRETSSSESSKSEDALRPSQGDATACDLDIAHSEFTQGFAEPVVIPSSSVSTDATLADNRVTLKIVKVSNEASLSDVFIPSVEATPPINDVEDCVAQIRKWTASNWDSFPDPRAKHYFDTDSEPEDTSSDLSQAQPAVHHLSDLQPSLSAVRAFDTTSLSSSSPASIHGVVDIESRLDENRPMSVGIAEIPPPRDPSISIVKDANTSSGRDRTILEVMLEMDISAAYESESSYIIASPISLCPEVDSLGDCSSVVLAYDLPNADENFALGSSESPGLDEPFPSSPESVESESSVSDGIPLRATGLCSSNDAPGSPRFLDVDSESPVVLAYDEPALNNERLPETDDYVHSPSLHTKTTDDAANGSIFELSEVAPRLRQDESDGVSLVLAYDEPVVDVETEEATTYHLGSPENCENAKNTFPPSSSTSSPSSSSSSPESPENEAPATLSISSVIIPRTSLTYDRRASLGISGLPPCKDSSIDIDQNALAPAPSGRKRNRAFTIFSSTPAGLALTSPDSSQIAFLNQFAKVSPAEVNDDVSPETQITSTNSRHGWRFMSPFTESASAGGTTDAPSPVTANTDPGSASDSPVVNDGKTKDLPDVTVACDPCTPIRQQPSEEQEISTLSCTKSRRVGIYGSCPRVRLPRLQRDFSPSDRPSQELESNSLVVDPSPISKRVSGLRPLMLPVHLARREAGMSTSLSLGDVSRISCLSAISTNGNGVPASRVSSRSCDLPTPLHNSYTGPAPSTPPESLPPRHRRTASGGSRRSCSSICDVQPESAPSSITPQSLSSSQPSTDVDNNPFLASTLDSSNVETGSRCSPAMVDLPPTDGRTASGSHSSRSDLADSQRDSPDQGSKHLADLPCGRWSDNTSSANKSHASQSDSNPPVYYEIGPPPSIPLPSLPTYRKPNKSGLRSGPRTHSRTHSGDKSSSSPIASSSSRSDSNSCSLSQTHLKTQHSEHIPIDRERERLRRKLKREEEVQGRLIAAMAADSSEEAKQSRPKPKFRSALPPVRARPPLSEERMRKRQLMSWKNYVDWDEMARLDEESRQRALARRR